MHLRKYTSVYQSLSITGLALLICAATAAQITTAKQPNPNITAPGPQRPQPEGGQRPPNRPSIDKAPPPIGALTTNPGDVEGFVYWDAHTIIHKPAESCSGIAVNISAVGSPNNIIAAGNHFKYAGQVKAFLYGGKQAVYDVCIYAYNHQPVGPQLQAQLVVTDRNAFSQGVVSQTAAVAPITIINAQCNMLPPIVPSTVGDLTSHWGSCQNRAYDVNFALTPAFQVMSSSGGAGGMLSSANNGGSNPGPMQSPSGGMLAGAATPGTQQSPSRGMLSRTKDPGPIQSPSNGEGAPGRFLPAKPSAATLTNTDIIGLVKGGVPESAIINQIQSSNKRFDFSPASCQALSQAHVSPQIIDSMGDGSVRPCFTGGVRSTGETGADDLNPQPFPPKAIANSQGMNARLRNRRTTVALSAPKQSQKIANPKLSVQNAAIIAVLQQQRRAADAEATQMKLGIRPVAAVSSQPATTMSANGNANPLISSSPAVSTTVPPPQGASSGSSTNRYGTLQPGMIAGLALQCGRDPGLRILTVSGGAGPAIFTQDDKYNFYTITGCSFGDPGPNSKAYLYYQGSFHQDFQIEEWSDNGIKLHLDPKLTGVDDQNNLTLVVQRTDGKQTSNGGYKFYAARDTTRLKQIPPSYFSLNKFRPDQSTIQNWKPIYTSESSPKVEPNLPGMSAEVHWDLTNDPNGAITGGNDLYDFSHLHSTFALSNALMEWKDVSCTDPNYNQFKASNDNWNIDWYQAAGIQVRWQGQMCKNTPGSCGGAFQGDCFEIPPESNYGIDVWVTGPRGLDPWTGKPGS
jgi:hypothetical protein